MDHESADTDQPGHDVTGVTCGYGQSGPGVHHPRNFPPCTVPAGVALLVPIVGTVCSTVEPPPYGGRDEAELRACAAAEVDRYTGIVVHVDGQAVPDIEAYRASSPRFTLPEHNVLGVPAGVAYAVADGYQVMVAPLPVGEHEIVAHVELTDGTVLPDKVLRVAVVEPLTIREPHRISGRQEPPRCCNHQRTCSTDSEWQRCL